MKYYSDDVNFNLKRGTEFSAGLDLPFYDPDVFEVTVLPGEHVKLPTGLYLEVQKGCVAFLDSRSSTSKLHLDLLCRTVDSDYRGQVYTVFMNVGVEPVIIKRGQCLAQVLEIPCYLGDPVKLDSRDELSTTGRGDGGFGSTDKKGSV